jgi:hypothetical protein
VKLRFMSPREVLDMHPTIKVEAKEEGDGKLLFAV